MVKNGIQIDAKTFLDQKIDTEKNRKQTKSKIKLKKPKLNYPKYSTMYLIVNTNNMILCTESFTDDETKKNNNVILFPFS